MKKYLIIIAFIIPLFALSQKATKKLAYKSLDSFFVDLNNDGKNDTISILSNTGDKSTFNRVLIKLSGYPKQIFNAKDYWTDFDSLFVKKNKNLVHSNLLFVKKRQTNMPLSFCPAVKMAPVIVSSFPLLILRTAR